jgi:hypothetical protein
VGGNGMNSTKYLGTDGLKELRENGLKGLKVSCLKDLILKPKDARIEDISDTCLEDLTKSKEQVKRKIRKLIKEKKEIEARIDLIRKTGKEKGEEISELPWREEIFPPLSRKVRVKVSGSLEVKKNYLHAGDTELSEVKVGGMEIEVRGINEKSEDETPEGKRSEDIILFTNQTIVVNDAEGTGSKNGTEKRDGDKAVPEREEKIKTLYPFSAGQVNENKISGGNSSENSIEKSKPESKKKPAASLFGDNLIEELLNSDDLNPEEEQGFMKYLEEQKIEELITDLKNVRVLLARAEHTG